MHDLPGPDYGLLCSEHSIITARLLVVLTTCTLGQRFRELNDSALNIKSTERGRTVLRHTTIEYVPKEADDRLRWSYNELTGYDNVHR